ncbi:MAG: alpha/beta family hydrolase [Gammaproteobacteria bacterium]
MQNIPKYVLVKEFLVDGPEEASHLLVLAHGAGAGMATPFMDFIAHGVAAAAIRVVRFHFPYMEESVRTGRKKPPDGGDILRACFSEVIEHCLDRERCPRDRLVIGGKSMGGRMATLIADEHRVAGAVCLGYPFHAPRQPERLRTGHLVNLHTPTLICQGERDPFGPRDEVSGYRLSPAIRIHWIADGNHDFTPRKSSGRSEEQNLRDAAQATVEFIQQLKA